MKSALWKLAKWFLFKLDAETVHQFTLLFIRLGISCGGGPLRIVSGVSKKVASGSVESTDLSRVKVFGVEFRSRIGLAAGFDKNCEILEGLPSLGFGFAEIGTVTPRPQAGNSRPRLFRNPDDETLFNRMGFNGIGAVLIADRLYQARKRIPENFRVGVNLGKNKDTPLQDSWLDYVRAAQAFKGLADYLVINVSSPNTPGLRSLQTVEALKPIVGAVAELISNWRKTPPLLLKLAPELCGEELAYLIEVMESGGGIEGWVLTNTLSASRSVDSTVLLGGLSGRVLEVSARQSLIEARRVSQKPIISVGGISSCEEAHARISGGASLLQIYTSWIYRGPSFPRELTSNRVNG